MKKIDSSITVLKRLLVVCIACVALLGSGCSFFGESNEDASELAGFDVCADVFNGFVTQRPDGLGITSDECVDSERGDWIDGQCYCHGLDE